MVKYKIIILIDNFPLIIIAYTLYLYIRSLGMRNLIHVPTYALSNPPHHYHINITYQIEYLIISSR